MILEDFVRVAMDIRADVMENVRRKISEPDENIAKLIKVLEEYEEHYGIK